MVVRVWWVFRTRLYGGETPQTPKPQNPLSYVGVIILVVEIYYFCESKR